MLRRVLNILGTLILLVMLALVLPLTVPKLFGLQLYEVQTGSMVPALPVHSVIYVKPCDVSEIDIQDVITFQIDSASDLVMTHRVVETDRSSETFLTKGDANEAVDQTPVPFQNVIGVVVFHIPILGTISAYIHTPQGIAATVAVFCVVILMWMVADRLKVKERVQ